MLKAAVLLATTSLVVAVPAGSSDPWWPPKPVTIRVYATLTEGSITKDVAPHTAALGYFTKGDAVSNSGFLRNVVPQFGKAKGWNVGTLRIVIVALSSQTVRDDRVARFPGGTVHARGERKVTTMHWKLPVVGGTGIYAGATGVLERLVLVTATDPVNIYRLQLP